MMSSAAQNMMSYNIYRLDIEKDTVISHDQFSGPKLVVILIHTAQIFIDIVEKQIYSAENRL